jgi:hypothetical protein
MLKLRKFGDPLRLRELSTSYVNRLEILRSVDSSDYQLDMYGYSEMLEYAHEQQDTLNTSKH